MSLEKSSRQQKVEAQPSGFKATVYLHKPTGVRYVVHHTKGDVILMEPIMGPYLRVSHEQLGDAEVWTKTA